MKHLTDEEKAKEIAKYCSVMPPTTITQADMLAMTENAAMQAMQWKDEQEIEFLQSLMFQAPSHQVLIAVINNRIKLLKGE